MYYSSIVCYAPKKDFEKKNSYALRYKLENRLDNSNVFIKQLRLTFSMKY